MNKPSLGSLLLMHELDTLSKVLFIGVDSIQNVKSHDERGVFYDPDTLDVDRYNDSGVFSYSIVSEFTFDKDGKAKPLFYDPFKKFGGESFLICEKDEDGCDSWRVEIYFSLDEDDPDYKIFDEDYAKIVVTLFDWRFDYD